MSGWHSTPLDKRRAIGRQRHGTPRPLPARAANHHDASPRRIIIADRVCGSARICRGSGRLPTHKIRMLLPYAAGGGGDVVGRLLADRMGKTLGQSIYIENHTGAAGALGTQMVATSPNDGYTITVGGMTTHVLAPAIYPKLSYDPIKDFTTIGRVGTSSIMLVATRT